jgi:MFS family permease
VSKRWIVPLVNRYGYDNFLLVNTLIVGASIASFAAMSPGWPLALSILQLATFGASNSMQFAAMNSVTLKGLSREDAGSGNSLFSMVQMLAIGLGVTIGGGLVSLFSNELGVAAPAYRLAFLAVGIITLLSAFVFRRLDGEALNPVRRAV